MQGTKYISLDPQLQVLIGKLLVASSSLQIVGVVKNKSCSVQFIWSKSPGIPIMVIPPPTHTIPAGDGDPSKEMNMFACACGTWTWCNRLIDSSNPNY